MSISNYCFLTCIHISQEAGKVVWYAHLFKNFLQFVDYAKAFDSVDHNKLWKILREKGMLDHLNHFLRTCMQVKKQQLELDME